MKRVSISALHKKKSGGEKITCLTVYDYPFARLADEAGIDCLLVSDVLGQVGLGYESTVPVSLEEMVHHTKAVIRGASRAVVIAKMPFLSCAGDFQSIFRYEGASWTQMTGPDPGYTFTSMAGKAVDDIYCTGMAGIIMHYDGSSWTHLDSAFTRDDIAADLPIVETGTQAAVAAAVLCGAHIVRVHDVASTRATIRILDAIRFVQDDYRPL